MMQLTHFGVLKKLVVKQKTNKILTKCIAFFPIKKKVHRPSICFFALTANKLKLNERNNMKVQAVKSLSVEHQTGFWNKKMQFKMPIDTNYVKVWFSWKKKKKKKNKGLACQRD